MAVQGAELQQLPWVHSNVDYLCTILDIDWCIAHRAGALHIGMNVQHDFTPLQVGPHVREAALHTYYMQTGNGAAMRRYYVGSVVHCCY